MKEYELLVFGVPKGFDSSQCDRKTRDFLMRFYAPHKPGITFKTIRLVDNTIYYILLIYENQGTVFTDVDNRTGSFFGISLSLYNEYFTNPEKIKNLLQDTYYKYVKNHIIEERPNGARRYKVSALNLPGDKIGYYVLNGMQELIKGNPEYTKIFEETKPLPPINQNQTQR